MFKLTLDDSEWSIFQNIINYSGSIYAKSKKEKELFASIVNADWSDNTRSRPDFISDEIMLEMFEIDDIVTTKKGKNNPQRKADARAKRTIEDLMSQFPEGTFNENVKIFANGDTRYDHKDDSFTPDDSVSHHNYKAYVNNYIRICEKHLDSVSAYRKNYPNKKLGFLILDDSTYYIPKGKAVLSNAELFYNLPIFDKNFMSLLVKSDVDFVIWIFNNKYVYTPDNRHGQNSIIPSVVLINKENFYNNKTKKFVVSNMESLEE